MRYWLLPVCLTFSLTLPSATAADEIPSLSFSENLGDKISLFGEGRLGTAQMYGFGVRDNTLVYKSCNTHSWVINENNQSVTPDMMLRTGRLAVNGSDPQSEHTGLGNDLIADIQNRFGNNSANAATLRLLERTDVDSEGGASLRYNGSSNRLHFGMLEDGTASTVATMARANRHFGIGTTNPSTRLHVVSDGTENADVLVEVERHAAMRFEANGVGSNSMLWLRAVNNNGDRRASLNAPATFVITVDNTIRVRIGDNGTVLLGAC